MTLTELNQLIGSLVEYHEKGSIALSGKSHGIDLTQEQIDALKSRCVEIKNEAIAIASSLTPGIFDLELDPILEE